VCSFPPRVGTASAKIPAPWRTALPKFSIVRERTSMPLRDFGFQSTFFKSRKMRDRTLRKTPSACLGSGGLRSLRPTGGRRRHNFFMQKNSVELIGFLGKDAQVKQSNNSNFTVLSVATKESWKNNETGEWQSRTEWQQIEFSRGTVARKTDWRA
jgi:Single-strand binding protein family